MKKLFCVVGLSIFASASSADSGFGALFYILKSNDLLSYENSEVKVAGTTRTASQRLESNSNCSVSFISEIDMGGSIHTRNTTLDFSKLSTRAFVFENTAGIVYQMSVYDLDGSGPISESFTIGRGEAEPAVEEIEAYIYTRYALDPSLSSKGRELQGVIEDVINTCD